MSGYYLYFLLCLNNIRIDTLSYTSLPKGAIKLSILLGSGHYLGAPYSFRVVQEIYECLGDLNAQKVKKGVNTKKLNENIGLWGIICNIDTPASFPTKRYRVTNCQSFYQALLLLSLKIKLIRFLLILQKI